MAIGTMAAVPKYAISSPSTQPPAIETRMSCPTDVETLTQRLLQDLPGYANRVLRRSQILDVPDDTYTFSVLLAGRAEYQPLDLKTIEQSQLDSLNSFTPPQQIFFTTLEQHYTHKKAYTTQNYHWLFLANSDSGWRIALLFTQFGSADPQRPPLPPRETSQGIVGQAIKIWLRDCRAGAI